MALTLDLRLRFLETLLNPPSASTSTSPLSLSRRVSLIQSLLNQSIDAGGGGEAVRRFVANYDLNAPLLSVPPVPLSDPANADQSVQGKVALILEAEQDIKTLERELREVEAFEGRGVVGAGSLEVHEQLKPALRQLQSDAKPVGTEYSALESRTNLLLTQYNDYISTLSEIFVEWNDIVSAAEEAVTRMKREKEKRLDVS